MADDRVDMSERPPGELWYRESRVLDVSFPQRTLELVVIPYDTEALVPHPDGERRMVKESVARGAFDGIERRANRIRVNRDHQLTRTVGRAVAFHPSRVEGLVAAVRIAKTELGDETLTLAEDDCLDASAGFLPMAGGMQWLTRQAYRVTRGWLGHIALTPEPAYENARVLAIRSAEQAPASETPNLDIVRGWRLADGVGFGAVVTDR